MPALGTLSECCAACLRLSILGALQARDEKVVREHVLSAERLLMLETGFRLPAYHLHGDVSLICCDLQLKQRQHQVAWNIVNDRRAPVARAPLVLRVPCAWFKDRQYALSVQGGLYAAHPDQPPT